MNGRGFQQSINELKKLFNSDATAAANQGRSGARCFVSTLPAHAVQATRSMCAAINSHQCARVRLRAARRGPDDRRDRHGLSPTTPPAAPAAARRSPATASTVGGTAWARPADASHRRQQSPSARRPVLHIASPSARCLARLRAQTDAVSRQISRRANLLRRQPGRSLGGMLGLLDQRDDPARQRRLQPAAARRSR